MSTWLERFVLAIMATVGAAIALTNPWQLAASYRAGLFVVIVAAAFPIGRAVEKIRAREIGARKQQESPTSTAAAAGGRGGGGNAVGEHSTVVGGRGGRGGHGGRGGDGGGGDAIGLGSKVIGGDGGDAGRVDGRGGRGGANPLKRLSPEELRSWGLTGDEGHGQGGAGANSPEYERSLRVLGLLSADYMGRNPSGQMTPMPGVLMPPVDWVNSRLADMGESFHIEIIDSGTDFLLRPNSVEDSP